LPRNNETNIQERRKMKAYLYREDEQPVEAVNEHNLAVADQKPAKVDVPKQGMYVVQYKPLFKATMVALVIFIVWALATWLLN